VINTGLQAGAASITSNKQAVSTAS